MPPEGLLHARPCGPAWVSQDPSILITSKSNTSYDPLSANTKLKIHREKKYHPSAKKKHTLIDGCCLVAKAYLTIQQPHDCSPSGSSVYGAPQTRIQEHVAISSSRGSSQPRDRTRISCICRWLFTTEKPGKPHSEYILGLKSFKYKH